MSASPDAPNTAETAAVEHPHDFEVQKELHQQIRNDPDYDDWEYGTEPLPHEAWVAKVSRDGGSVQPAAS
ncbi:MAG: hypothetical protein ACKO5M_03310 [Vulcanococcus sp.]